MSTLVVLALIAAVVLVLYWAWWRWRIARYEAERRAEIAQAARARRLAELRINHLAQSALEQMIEAAGALPPANGHGWWITPRMPA